MSVILPGSYDPITAGHLDIIKRVAKAENEVYLVAFINPDKEYMFSLEDRVSMMMLATDDLENVIVSYSMGYVVDYMREHGIEKIVKGYRNARDLEYEKVQAEYNMAHGGYPTEFLLASPEYSEVSSTEVREAIKRGADISKLVPPRVEKYINELFKQEKI